jgi:hypothetical protein
MTCQKSNELREPAASCLPLAKPFGVAPDLGQLVLVAPDLRRRGAVVYGDEYGQNLGIWDRDAYRNERPPRDWAGRETRRAGCVGGSGAGSHRGADRFGQRRDTRPHALGSPVAGFRYCPARTRS